jgi:hypothetical protein
VPYQVIGKARYNVTVNETKIVKMCKAIALLWYENLASLCSPCNCR